MVCEIQNNIQLISESFYQDVFFNIVITILNHIIFAPLINQII